MARRPPEGNGLRDAMRVHVPGCYIQILDKSCSEKAHSGEDYLTASADPLNALEFEWRVAERKAALMAEGNGRPVRCQSHDLPSRIGSPFERFPLDGQRQFVVFPNDEIVLQPRQLRSA